MNTSISDMIPDDAMAAVRKPLAEASLLPPVAYSSARIFEYEQDRVFPRSWLPVCHVSQLAGPASFLTRTVAREPILVVKDKAGEIKVYSNICRHRNAVLVTGEGNCKGNRFSCPYHGWTYGLDGRLLAAPFMDKTEGFQRKDYSLAEIRFEIWQGFIFINMDGSAPALAPQLRGLELMIRDYGFADTVAEPLFRIDADWNWKVSLENFTEAYHQPWVHPESAEPSAPAAGARYYDNGSGPWSAFLIPNAEEIEAFAMKNMSSDGPVSHDAPPSSIGEGALVFNIYPYFHALATPQGTLWLDFEIGDINRHTMIWRVLFPREAVKNGAEEAIAGVKSFMEPVMDEDIRICRRVGPGVSARLARQGRPCHMEKAVHQFHNWWLDAIEGRTG